MTLNKKILLIILLISAIALIVGITKVLQGNFNQISLPFIPLVIFVWGDALIFGPFFILGCLWLWHKNNYVWTGMFFSTYYAVRLFIEALYNLNAQFSETVRPWESTWQKLTIVQDIRVIQIYMLAQIFFTVGAIVAFLIFVSYFKKYLSQK